MEVRNLRKYVERRWREGDTTIVVFRGMVHGAGASTLADTIVKAVPIRSERVSAGDIFEKKAEERGISVKDFSAYLSSHPEEAIRIDVDLDRAILSKVLQAKGRIPLIVADSNVLPFYLHVLGIPMCAFLVYARPEVVGERLFRASRRKDGRLASPEEAIRVAVERMRVDALRYSTLAQRVSNIDPILAKAYKLASKTYLELVRMYNEGSIIPLSPFSCVIDNSGSVERSLEQVDAYFSQLVSQE